MSNEGLQVSKKKLQVIKSNPQERLESQMQWLAESNANMVRLLCAILQRNGGELTFAKKELEITEEDLKELKTSADPYTGEVKLTWNKPGLITIAKSSGLIS